MRERIKRKKVKIILFQAQIRIERSGSNNFIINVFLSFFFSFSFRRSFYCWGYNQVALSRFTRRPTKNDAPTVLLFLSRRFVAFCVSAGAVKHRREKRRRRRMLNQRRHTHTKEYEKKTRKTKKNMWL
jgi:hypothetical protein